MRPPPPARSWPRLLLLLGPALAAALWLPQAHAQGADAEHPSDAAADRVPDPDRETALETPAGGEEAPPARARVAVLLLTTGDLDPTVADSLSEVLIGGLAARGGLTIVGKEEFQAQLGRGDEGTLECISSMACLGRVGVQLGVAEVIAGTLAHRDGRWVYNLNRVDVRAGEIVGRVFQEFPAPRDALGDLADALNAAIPGLYAPPRQPELPEEQPTIVEEPELGTLVVTSVPGASISALSGDILRTSRAPLEDLFPAGEVGVTVSAAGYHTWRQTVHIEAGQTLRVEVELREAYGESIQPLALVSLGVAALSLGVGIGLGVVSQETLEINDVQRLEGDLLRSEVLSFYDARRLEAIGADVLFGLAGGAAIAAFVLFLFPERHPEPGVSILPSPTGLALRGRF